MGVPPLRCARGVLIRKGDPDGHARPARTLGLLLPIFIPAKACCLCDEHHTARAGLAFAREAAQASTCGPSYRERSNNTQTAATMVMTTTATAPSGPRQSPRGPDPPILLIAAGPSLPKYNARHR